MLGVDLGSTFGFSFALALQSPTSPADPDDTGFLQWREEQRRVRKGPESEQAQGWDTLPVGVERL